MLSPRHKRERITSHPTHDQSYRILIFLAPITQSRCLVRWLCRRKGAVSQDNPVLQLNILHFLLGRPLFCVKSTKNIFKTPLYIFSQTRD